MTRATRFVSSVLFVIVSISWQSGVNAQENPVHEELRTLKRNAEAAFNKGDLDGLFKYVDEDVVATWQNADVTRRHDGVRAYYDKMLTGKDSVVRTVKTEITVDNLSQLYGTGTAVSTGGMAQHFELRDGLEFDLSSRWTATVIRSDGQWKIAAFHVSANVFDNPILSLAVRRTASWVGAGAILVGLVVGVGLGQWLKRKRVQAG